MKIKRKIRKKIRKKAQTHEMFFYIIALIIIGLTLILGVKYIKKIVGYSEEFSLVQFKLEIENDINMLSTRYGSWRTNSYAVPKGVREICFFDLAKDPPQNCASIDGLDSIMCDAWQSKTENVMSKPAGGIKSRIYLPTIKISSGMTSGAGTADPQYATADTGYLCFPAVNGRITVKMVGLGNSVLISEP